MHPTDTAIRRPTDASASDAGRADAADERAGRPIFPIAPRILVADDQPDVLEALRLLLKGEGYQIETAASPAGHSRRSRTRTSTSSLMDLNYARDTTSGQEGLDLLHDIRNARSDAAGRGDDRLGQRRPRGRGDAARRARLRPEAVGQRAAARHRAHAGRARRRRCDGAAARGREPHAARRGPAARSSRESPRHAAGAADDRARRAVRRERADHRRERHGQGPGRAGAARRLGDARRAPWSPSTSAASPKACSRASCSATSRARSPTPRPTASAASSWPTAARCSSTRSRTCR